MNFPRRQNVSVRDSETTDPVSSSSSSQHSLSASEILDDVFRNTDHQSRDLRSHSYEQLGSCDEIVQFDDRAPPYHRALRDLTQRSAETLSSRIRSLKARLDRRCIKIERMKAHHIQEITRIISENEQKLFRSLQVARAASLQELRTLSDRMYELEDAISRTNIEARSAKLALDAIHSDNTDLREAIVDLSNQIASRDSTIEALRIRIQEFRIPLPGASTTSSPYRLLSSHRPLV